VGPITAALLLDIDSVALSADRTTLVSSITWSALKPTYPTEIRYPGLPEVTSSAVPGSDAVCAAVREWLQTPAADDL
jgi:hypothetical protein